jgi:hypothetical protein
MEHLLKTPRFSGRIWVVVPNGDVLKSGYEEGVFSSEPDQFPAGTKNGERMIERKRQLMCASVGNEVHRITK